MQVFYNISQTNFRTFNMNILFNRTTQAKDPYTSQLFRLCLEYVKTSSSNKIFITC